MGISSTGIGSGLDVAGLISKLMAAESAPLLRFDQKAAAYQTKLDALSKLGAALGSFQGSLSALSTPATFRALTATVGDKSILGASTGKDTVPGNYNINVTQLAQAQSLSSAGKASMTATIGGGALTTLSFQFGTTSGGIFGMSGASLSAAVASGGISNGALTINGTAIATDGTTRSARLLADAINAKSGTTGVTATAGKTATSATLFGAAGSTSFGAVNTTAGASYTLSVGGVTLGQQGGATAVTAGVTAATIDTALTGNTATTVALAAANITFTGNASNGTLQFFAADGANLTVSEAVSGSVTGGINNTGGAANFGSSVTATAGVTLSSASASPITVGGSAPGAAGLAAGSGGSYLGASFAQDGSVASGSVVLGAGDQSLQGIRDAINKANIGVQASIISDGSASPYHLVLTSTKTGATSSMKISVSGDGAALPDPALAAMLGYDTAGAQGLTQTSAAQSTLLNVNGIAVSSASDSVTEAIQGVTLNVTKLGSTSVSITRDNNAVKDAVNSFVKAYNDLNKTIKDLTGYNPDTKKGGALQGDSTTRSILSQLRQQLGVAVTGVSGNINTLSQVGIEFQKDGSLAVNSTKLQKAVTENFTEIGGLFAAIGSATDSLVAFNGSTVATQPGTYAVNISALASKGSLTSAAALSGATLIGANTVWTVTLNQTQPETASKVANITLKAGTYNNTDLAAMLRAAINGHSSFAGNGDTVETAIDGAGKLSLSSNRWGSASNIAISTLSGTAATTVFGAAVPVAGVDVAGTIGGMSATGAGQTLTAAGGTKAEGLKLDITGGAIGERGTISFSQGYAYQLNKLAGSFLGVDGLITNKADGLNGTMKSVTKSRQAFNDRLAEMEKRYRAQFTALDTALASMQATSSYLTQQLAALANHA